MNRRAALAALMSLPATAVISQAKVEPDDTIVIECDKLMPDEVTERIRHDLEQVWPGRKIVVLTHGLKMRIAKGL